MLVLDSPDSILPRSVRLGPTHPLGHKGVCHTRYFCGIAISASTDRQDGVEPGRSVGDFHLGYGRLSSTVGPDDAVLHPEDLGEPPQLRFVFATPYTGVICVA